MGVMERLEQLKNGKQIDCKNCKHFKLYNIRGSISLVCTKKDKLILPDFPPTICEEFDELTEYPVIFGHNGPISEGDRNYIHQILDQTIDTFLENKNKEDKKNDS